MPEPAGCSNLASIEGQRKLALFALYFTKEVPMKYFIYAGVACFFAICTVRCAGGDLQQSLQERQDSRQAVLSAL